MLGISIISIINALLIETEFGDERMINGYFILMPEEESYAKILSSLGIQL